MDKLLEISNYVRDLTIKKTFFGGYDRDDVFEKIQELMEMFRAYAKEEKLKQQKIMEDYELRIRASQAMVGELNKKIAVLSEEQKNAEAEKKQMRTAYKEYCSQMLGQYSDSLRTLSTEFTQIMENITALQQNLLEEDFLDAMEVRIEDAMETEETEAIEERDRS